MPLYNSARFLNFAINSVMSQTYDNWELILVDDYSSDDSVRIAEAYVRKDKRIILYKQPRNLGVSQARNKGIREANGRFIAFLDSDDIWYPQKLALQIQHMVQNEIDFTYTSYEKIDEQGDVIGHLGVPVKVNYSDLLKTCVIGCLTAVYDTRTLGKVYMPTNTKREDFATWLSILDRTKYAYGVTVTLAQYRVYKNQSSGKKVNMAMENWKLYYNVLQLGFFRSTYYFSHYAIKGLLRTKTPRLAKVLRMLD